MKNNQNVEEQQVNVGLDVEIYNGKITVIRRYKTSKFEGFEFQIEGTILVDEDNEIETDYFRYESHKDGGQYIIVAEQEPEFDGYYVYEEASWFFDIDQIDKECRKQFAEGIVTDETKAYLEFCAEDEETSWF